VKTICAISIALAGILCAGIGFSAEEADTSTPASSPKVEQAETETSTAVKPYAQEAGGKLKRAAVNLARSGTEFYVQPLEAKRQSGKAIAMAWPGMGEACGMFLTRLLGGCIEGATFAIPFPNGWKPLLDE
jgi:hypothetical protein